MEPDFSSDTQKTLAAPLGVFQQLKDVAPGAYRFLGAGLLAFAAAGTARGIMVDGPEGTTTIKFFVGLVLSVIGVALLIWVVLHMTRDAIQRAVLSWFVCIAVMITLVAAAFSVWVPQGPIPHFLCWFSLSVSECRQDVLAQTSPPLMPAAVTTDPPAPAEETANRVVDVKFAGSITRDSIMAFSNALAAQGWALSEHTRDRGGLRTPLAEGVNEVRYAAGDEAAANELAQAISTMDVNNRQPVKTVEVSDAEAGILQVWISR